MVVALWVAPICAAPSMPKGALGKFATIAAAARQDDCKTVMKLAPDLARSRDFASLPDEARSATLELLSTCELTAGRQAEAYKHSVAATAIETASDFAWRIRLASELDAEQPAAALATVEMMSQGHGAALNSVPVQWMGRLDELLTKPAQPELRLRLFAVLASSDYAPEEFGGDNEAFRFRYAHLLAEAGRLDEARPFIVSLRSPGNVEQASLSPKFRSIFPSDPDVRALAEAQLARQKDLIGREPDKLGPIQEAAATLLRLGRPDEAVALLETVRPRIGQPGAFTDREQPNWWWDALGRAHAMAGRYEDAAASFRSGAQIKEGNQPNISQTINLAEMQNSFGHGDEALKTLAVFEDPARKGSGYGEMELRFARGCAQVLTGHPEAASADLDYAKGHEKDHPEALADLLLCMGDLDGAAAAFIRRLDDPERSQEALLQLSEFDPPPVPRSKDTYRANLAKMKVRADVKEAIARAGGIRRFHLQPRDL